MDMRWFQFTIKRTLLMTFWMAVASWATAGWGFQALPVTILSLCAGVGALLGYSAIGALIGFFLVAVSPFIGRISLLRLPATPEGRYLAVAYFVTAIVICGGAVLMGWLRRTKRIMDEQQNDEKATSS